jgi:uncharacterized protein YecE (DUF72 family)
MSWVTSGPCWSSSARHTDLIWWAERIREWAARGANTLAYFNNDGDANTVRNARTFRGMRPKDTQ